MRKVQPEVSGSFQQFAHIVFFVAYERKTWIENYVSMLNFLHLYSILVLSFSVAFTQTNVKLFRTRVQDGILWWGVVGSRVGREIIFVIAN